MSRMSRAKLGYFPAILGLIGSVGVLPTASAVIHTISYEDVVNSSPNCGAQENCTVAALPKATCPIGSVGEAVTVRLLDVDMDTNLVAANITGAPICYNAININHQFLALTIDEAVAPAALNGPGNSDGSGDTIANFGGCGPGFNSPPFQHYVLNNGNVNQSPMLETLKNTPSEATYNNPSAGFNTYYGAGTFTAKIEAQAQIQQEGPGTFVEGVQTNAVGRIEIRPECVPATSSTVPNVPAGGSVGLGALGLGLGAIAVMVGFRRRRG